MRVCSRQSPISPTKRKHKRHFNKFVKNKIMDAEARKLHVIEEVLKVQDEAVLIEVEDVLKKRNAIQKNKSREKPSDYAGCISKETAKQLLQQIEESRNEWESGI
jgi:hypothetical protein